MLGATTMCAWFNVIACGCLALVASVFGGCNGGDLGDTPTEQCVPEGACDESMFHGGISAEQGDATRGEVIFARDCARCHGETGKGLLEARRVDMTSPAWQASMRDGTIVKTTRAGKAPMPAFTFADQELKDILAHIRRLEVAPVAPTKKGY